MNVTFHQIIEVFVVRIGSMLLSLAAVVFVIPLEKIGKALQNEFLFCLIFFALFTGCIGFSFFCLSVFRRIPARCPECGGKTYSEGNRPVIYRCRNCGHVVVTHISANWGKE
jgi:hypothetical protein